MVFQKCIFIESFGKFGVFKNGQNGVKIRGFGDGPFLDLFLEGQNLVFTLDHV